MVVRLVVYDETEAFRINDETLLYPFEERKTNVGPSVRLKLRDKQSDLYPPYVYLDHRDDIFK